MGFGEDIASLGQQFAQAAHGLAIQRAVAGATEQVNQIKSAEGDEIQKQSQLRQVSEALTRDLAQFGAPADRIALIANSISKPSPMYQTVDEALVNEKPGTEKYKNADILKKREFQQQIDLVNAKNNAAGKEKNQDKKTLADLQKDLDPNQARAGNLGTSQKMLNAADRVDALFKQFPDYNVPKAQTTELASAVGALVSGGSIQSQKQLDELTPESLHGKAQAQLSYIFNDPKGLGQQKFMKLMHETALRERAVAEKQVRQAQVQRLGKYQEFADKHPEVFNGVLKNYGINPDYIVGGQWSPPAPTAPAGGAPAGAQPPAAGSKPSIPGLTF